MIQRIDFRAKILYYIILFANGKYFLSVLPHAHTQGILHIVQI